ncbi:MAG: hypothetical protein ACI4O7_00660 [Aristaeellaceae bacterium]
MKKLTAICLAVLMLALPVLGCAATSGELVGNARDAGMPLKTTVTFTPADLTDILDEEIATVYSDLLNALSLEVYQNGSEGRLSVQLSGNDVLTLAGAFSGDTTFLNSNFLGSRSIAVDADEWQPLLERLVDLLEDAGELDEEEAALARVQLAGMFSGEAVVQMDAENAFADVDWTPVIDLMTGLMADRGETETVTEQPADCDKAMTRATLTLTGEDMVKIYRLAADCIRKSANAMAYLDMQLASTDMTAEELFTEFISAMEETCEEISMTYVLTMYMALNGDLVSMDVDTTMTDGDVMVKIPLTYRRLTGEQGVTHTMSLRCAAEDAEVMTMDLLYLDADPVGMITFALKVDGGDDLTLLVDADAVFDDRNVDASFKSEYTEYDETVAINLTLLSLNEENTSSTDVNLQVIADDEEIGITLKLNGEQTPGDTTAGRQGGMSLTFDVDGVDISLEGDYTTQTESGANSVRRETNANVGMTVMGMELPLCSVKAVTENCDALPFLADSECVHPAAMSDEELGAYAEDIASAAQIAVLTVIQYLPTSVLAMMMGN